MKTTEKARKKIIYLRDYSAIEAKSQPENLNHGIFPNNKKE